MWQPTPSEIEAAAGLADTATRFFAERVEDFEAICLTGSYQEVERTRQFAIAAAEAFLDRLYEHANLILMSWGSDPAARAR